MNKTTFALKFSVLLLFLVSSFNIHSQGLLEELSLEEQVKNSSHIIEGEVLSKKSYWDADHKHIYTVNTIKVHKIFKGDVAEEVKLVTPGGTIGLKAEIVSPSLNVYKNERGVFLLNTKNLQLDSSDIEPLLYEAYSSVQGFYRYNEYNNIVANTFKTRQNIVSGFYKELINLIGNDYKQLTNFDVQSEINRVRNESSTLEITSISPTTSSAGTESILTITGNGFTNTQWRVGFPNADNGGSTYIDTYEPQIIEWSNTEIRVMIPSFAGTGPVRVTTTTGTQFFSDVLTLDYAHINLIPNGADPEMEYPTQLKNDDGAGGYNWLYQTEFNANTAAKESFRRAFDSWVCESGVNWTIGGTNGTDVADDDGINIIRFDNGAELPGGVLGRTTSYFNGCSSGSGVDWFVIELDIVFNDTTNWNYGPDAPVGSEVDFETVAVHELGHGSQLGHIIDNEAIMHYAISPQTANRGLAANDIIGAEAILNRSANDPVCNQPVMTESSCSLSSEEFLANSISVFPNPVNTILNIRSNGDFGLNNAIIYDIQGRDVLSQSLETINGNSTIDVTSINSGIYFIQIESNRGTLTKKIIIR